MRSVPLPAMLLILVLPLGAVDGEAPSPALWKASRGEDVVWLFGTVHVGRADMYPFPVTVLEAIAGSEALALEVDMDDPAMMTKELEYGFYKKGDDLTRHLRPESLELLEEHLQGTGQSVDLMKGAKPWYLTMLLTMSAVAKEGFDMFRGVEIHLMQTAKQRGKPIIGLEDPDVRYPLLDRVDQDLFLTWSLKMLDDQAATLHRTIDLWKSGEVDTLGELLFAPETMATPGVAEMLDLLLLQRNTHMVGATIAHLQHYDRLFVAVGTAHLVGAGSVNELLTAEGFTVERVATRP